MKILIEAHHPAHLHFWKFPVRELISRGHQVLMISRDRDVMRRLSEFYDWIPHFIPLRRNQKNKIPLLEMLSRQFHVCRSIVTFNPNLITSLDGSYSQCAKLLGKPNIIFTDSEFQHFNHRITVPFADQIHTPYCFYKDLGPKQRFYSGIHEMAFLDNRYWNPDPFVLEAYPGLESGKFVLIRLSAWNTFHDIRHQGVGKRIYDFISSIPSDFRLVISAEENQLPEDLRAYAIPFPPEKFHDVLAHARFVLTEGASTASEAACMGVPTVYINSTEPRGYLEMLEHDYALVRNFRNASDGIPCAIEWLTRINDAGLARMKKIAHGMMADHENVVDYVIKVLERNGQ